MLILISVLEWLVYTLTRNAQPQGGLLDLQPSLLHSPDVCGSFKALLLGHLHQQQRLCDLAQETLGNTFPRQDKWCLRCRDWLEQSPGPSALAQTGLKATVSLVTGTPQNGILCGPETVT